MLLQPHKITGAGFGSISSEAICYGKCTVINTSAATAGNVSIVEFNAPLQYCRCKTNGVSAYKSLIASGGWNTNIAGNCAMYPLSKLQTRDQLIPSLDCIPVKLTSVYRAQLPSRFAFHPPETIKF